MRLLRAFGVACCLAVFLASSHGQAMLLARPSDIRPMQPFGNCTEEYWRAICGGLWEWCAWLYGCG